MKMKSKPRFKWQTVIWITARYQTLITTESLSSHIKRKLREVIKPRATSTWLLNSKRHYCQWTGTKTLKCTTSMPICSRTQSTHRTSKTPSWSSSVNRDAVRSYGELLCSLSTCSSTSTWSLIAIKSNTCMRKIWTLRRLSGGMPSNKRGTMTAITWI